MMFKDLTTVNVPFGLLDRETQVALKAHGGPYECFRSIDGDACWRDPCNATFDTHPALSYRVKPAPPKPREWWAVGCVMKSTEAEAQKFLDELNAQHSPMDFGKVIHVREVLPE